MPRKLGRDIVHRWEGNPTITLEDLHFRCSDILNAGVARTGEEYVLLITTEGLEGRFAIYPARSYDGHYFDVDNEPLLYPSDQRPYAPYEAQGVQDPRVVWMDDTYYITYHARGPHGYCMGLARTDDFRSVERLGIISQPESKSGALFPEKVKGRYARLERPEKGSGIWISYSDDMVFWGASEWIMGARGGYWDGNRIGVGAPPIRVEAGWLCIYYGIKDTSAGPLCRLGAALLDGEDPVNVIGRSDVPILSPREDYERLGDLPNTVFTCGAIMEPDDRLKIYYGASDSCICLGTVPTSMVIERCMSAEREI